MADTEEKAKGIVEKQGETQVNNNNNNNNNNNDDNNNNNSM